MITAEMMTATEKIIETGLGGITAILFGGAFISAVVGIGAWLLFSLIDEQFGKKEPSDFAYFWWGSIMTGSVTFLISYILMY